MGGGPRGPRPGGGSRPFGPPGTRRPRRKVCVFCLEKVKRIDYKDKPRLQRFLSDRAKIDPRRKSGNCAKHQRMLTTALKRARYMALLPYTAEHVRAMMSPSQRALAGGPPPARPERYGPRPPFAPRPEGPRPEGAAPGAGPATRPAEPAGPRPEAAAAPRAEPATPRTEGPTNEAS
jgi:small subunit ribosomal protein S18